jgi:hypothetical protein
MATKVGTKESKVTAGKPAPARAAARAAAPAAKSKPRAAANKLSKGDAYLCEICGLGVNVDVCGDFLETTGLYCCNKAMKKTGTAKAAKK